jgi:hemerythrin-like domain-containing protein
LGGAAIYVALMDDRTMPTTELRADHELILGVAESLSVVVEADPESLDYETVARCISFFRLFADACHHGKEEDLLFPALAAQGLPQEGGPVAVMLHEHEESRALLRSMSTSVEGAKLSQSGAAEDLMNAAKEYIELITAHIGKENNILFNIADELIDGQDCRDLCAAYDELSEQRYEGYSKHELVDIAREIIDET